MSCRLEEVNHRRVSTRVITEPDFLLSRSGEPLEQEQERSKSVANIDDDGELFGFHCTEIPRLTV